MIRRLIANREVLLLGAIGLLLALIATRFPGFVAPANLANVFNDTSPLILLATGQMIVILTKCIDLSVAANLALTGMAAAMLDTIAPGLPVPAILALAKDSAEAVRCEAIAALANLAVNDENEARPPTAPAPAPVI